MTPTRRRWLIAGGAAAALGVAFAAGRWSKPTPSVHLEEHAQEAVQTQRKETATATVQAETHADRQEVRVVYRDRWRQPSGAEHVREVETTATAEQVRAVTQAAAHHEEQEARVEVRTVERRVEVEAPLPDWRVSALVGGELGAGLVYGAEVSRRILGPISVGVWGLSSGAGGIELSLPF